MLRVKEMIDPSPLQVVEHNRHRCVHGNAYPVPKSNHGDHPRWGVRTFPKNPKLKNLKASRHTTPMRCTPKKRRLSEMQARKVHPYEMHAQWYARL